MRAPAEATSAAQGLATSAYKSGDVYRSGFVGGAHKLFNKYINICFAKKTPAILVTRLYTYV